MPAESECLPPPCDSRTSTRVTARQSDRPVLPVAAGALVATVASLAWFGTRPAMRVLVGTEALEQTVPLAYQVAVFPAFGALSAVVLVRLRGHGRNDRMGLATVALVAISSGAAGLRLAGWVPLSGHALFLSAAALYAATLPEMRALRLSLVLSVSGLAVTAWYKLAVWGDAGWFAVSCAAGCLLGWVLARAAR